jgi:hypothetical protein
MERTEVDEENAVPPVLDSTKTLYSTGKEKDGYPPRHIQQPQQKQQSLHLNLVELCTEEANLLLHPLAGQLRLRREGRKGAAEELGGRLSRAHARGEREGRKGRLDLVFSCSVFSSFALHVQCTDPTYVARKVELCVDLV